GGVAHGESYLHIYDDFTLVFASKPVMEKFLQDGAKPKFLTQVPTEPATPPSTKPEGQPMPGGNPQEQPPKRGGKMSSAPRHPQDATEPAVEVVAVDSDYQFVAFQGGQPGPDGQPGPKGQPEPGGKPNPNPTPEPTGPGTSFLTVSP